jgi:hypothetical protein
MKQEHGEKKSVHQVSKIIQPGCRWLTVEGSAAQTVCWCGSSLEPQSGSSEMRQHRQPRYATVLTWLALACSPGVT